MFEVVWKAFVIGATMMVPGVSGGSMATILGIYDRLIDSVSNFLKDIKKNLSFLAIFCIAALIGMLLLARPILSIIDKEPQITLYFFIGLVVGSVPMIWKATGVDKLNVRDVLFFALGITIVLMVELIPEGLLASEDTDFLALMTQALGGFLVSIGFLLPGISFSYLLLVLGLYPFIMAKIASFQLLALMPFGFGFVLGIVILTRFLGFAMHSFPRITYLMILGFLIGSIFPIWPGMPSSALRVVLSVVTFACGFIIIFLLGKKEKNSKIH